MNTKTSTKRKIIPTIFLNLFFLAVAIPGYSQLQTWEYNGPEFKSVHALVISPMDPDYIYAATKNGVFKGYRYIAPPFRIFWEPAGLSDYEITTLVISQQDPNVLYAGTAYQELFKTSDGSANWTAVNTPGTVCTLVIDPQDDNTLYVITNVREGVHKSTDGGITWNLVNNGLYGYWYQSLAVDPLDSSVLYIGSRNAGGVFKSTDGGGSWFPINNGIPAGYISTLAIDPVDTDVVYAGTENNGVYKTSNGGTNWAAANSGLSINNVKSMVIAPDNPSTIFVGANFYGGYGVAKSIDGGLTWNDMNIGMLTDGYITALAVEWNDPYFMDIVYAGSGNIGNVYREALPYYNFGPAIIGLHNPNAAAIVVRKNPLQVIPEATSEPQPIPIYLEDYIYAATGNGLFKKTRGYNPYPFPHYGWGNWVRLAASGIPDTEVIDLVAGHKNIKLLYAITGLTSNELYKSSDGGNNWTALTHPITSPNFLNQIEINPRNDWTIYILGYNPNGFYKSTDGGVNWQQLAPGLITHGGAKMAVDPGSSTTLYYGCMHTPTLYKSTDGGSNWTLINNGLSRGMLCIAVAPSDPDTIYLGMNLGGGGIYKSSDGGQTWYQYNNGLETCFVMTIAIDPQNEDILYAGDGGNDNMFFKSTDGGVSWTRLNTGFNGAGDYVRCMTIEAIEGFTLYAGLLYSGIWTYKENTP